MSPMRFSKAFTLIELVIVIVVLAVLAGIASFTYSNFVQDARKNTNETTVNSFAKSYAGNWAALADTEKALISAVQDVGGDVDSISYFPATTRNIATALNPSSSGGGSTLVNLATSYNNQTGWKHYTKPAGGYQTRWFVPESELQNGQTYRFSITVANPTSTSKTVAMDWVDVTPGSTYVLAPGEIRRISAVGSRAAYSNIYRFADVGLVETGELYLKDPLLEPVTSNGTFFSGSTPTNSHYTYAWEGAANASVSIRTSTSTYGKIQFSIPNSNTTYCIGLDKPENRASYKITENLIVGPGQYKQSTC